MLTRPRPKKARPRPIKTKTMADETYIKTSLVVLTAWPWPPGSSRTPFLGLGLGLGWPGLGLGNAGLGLEEQVLDPRQGQDLSKTWEKSWFSNQWCWFCLRTMCVQEQIQTQLLISPTRNLHSFNKFVNPLKVCHNTQFSWINRAFCVTEFSAIFPYFVRIY